MAKDLLKSIHDQLIENMPDGAEHDTCALCAESDTQCDHTAKDGEMSTVTNVSGYTQEAVDAAIAAAVAAATAPLQEKIGELQLAATQETSAKEKADLEAQLAELQLAHDKINLDLAEAVKTHDEFLAGLEALATAEAEEEAKKAKKGDRIAKMKMYAFTDEYVDSQADRWAAMDDEQFDAYVADLEATGAKKSEAKADDKKEDEKLPSATAMTASANAKPAGSGYDMSSLKEVLSMKLRGIDPSTL